jgi:hypothetical protein
MFYDMLSMSPSAYTVYCGDGSERPRKGQASA